MDKLGKAIRELVGDMTTYAILAKVISVDENRRTANCEPLNGDAIFKNCRLNAQENNENGFVFIPKINSIVIIMKIDENKAYVAMFSEIEKVLQKVGNTEIEINSSEIIFNKGNNGGLIKISENVSKLNKLESEINELKALLSAWVPIPLDGGAALKAVITQWSLQLLQPTVRNELENTKIKH